MRRAFYIGAAVAAILPTLAAAKPAILFCKEEKSFHCDYGYGVPAEAKCQESPVHDTFIVEYDDEKAGRSILKRCSGVTGNCDMSKPVHYDRLGYEFWGLADLDRLETGRIENPLAELPGNVSITRRPDKPAFTITMNSEKNVFVGYGTCVKLDKS